MTVNLLNSGSILLFCLAKKANSLLGIVLSLFKKSVVCFPGKCMKPCLGLLLLCAIMCDRFKNRVLRPSKFYLSNRPIAFFARKIANYLFLLKYSWKIANDLFLPKLRAAHGQRLWKNNIFLRKLFSPEIGYPFSEKGTSFRQPFFFSKTIGKITFFCGNHFRPKSGTLFRKRLPHSGSHFFFRKPLEK